MNAVIGWYRRATTQVPPVSQPSDAIYQSNAQSIAAQAVLAAFQSAKAEAALIPAAAPAPGPNANPGNANPGNANPGNAGSGTGAPGPERLTQTLAKVNARISALQAQIVDLNNAIAKAPRRNVQNLTGQRDALAGSLDLNKEMQTALQQLIKSSNADHTGDLQSSITQLERSIPEVSGVGIAPSKAAIASPASPRSEGLLGNVLSLYDQVQSMHQINLLLAETDRLRAAALKERTPLQAALRATIRQGQELADQSSPPQDGSSSAQPTASREQFDELAARFKQIAAATLPIGQEIKLLDQSKSNLTEWHDSISRESGHILRSILFNVAVVALAMGFILLLSEIWRRITFRYVHDPRRRRQFLLIRRIVVAFCMGMVIILGFVSEFSSLATFAGFITAGLAVGLQTILLSVAAYFFLAGRWGIRVGDRISISGVTGDVIDSGLVRFYLMELAGSGVDLYPTGRVAVFANSVLFQPTTPLFKQVPGAQYSWHEAAVLLKPDADYQLVEEKLLEGVNSVYTDYREGFAQQHHDVERRIDIPLTMPEPSAQLHSTEAGLEFVIRYPVPLQDAAEADGKVTRSLMAVIAQQEGLKAAISGPVRIRSSIKS